jgi:hypothetical protein
VDRRTGGDRLPADPRDRYGTTFRGEHEIAALERLNRNLADRRADVSARREAEGGIAYTGGRVDGCSGQVDRVADRTAIDEFKHRAVVVRTATLRRPQQIARSIQGQARIRVSAIAA